MGCWWSESSKEPEPLIPDVEKIIADYAWEKFCDTASRWRRFRMRRKDYTIEVPMNYFHFKEITVPKVDGIGDLQVTAHAAAKRQNKLTAVHPERTHLQNRFVNKTGDLQRYEFRFEKTRSASVSVSYQKGFSIGGKANFALDFAKVPGLEIEARYEVKKESGETFDESVTTSVTSVVEVKPYSARTAVVIMEERRIHAKFEVTVKMTMPIGTAMVYIKNKHGERVSTRQINHLGPVFKGKYETMQHSGKEARFKVVGVVEGSVLSNHQICLEDSDILESDLQDVSLEGSRSLSPAEKAQVTAEKAHSIAEHVQIVSENVTSQGRVIQPSNDVGDNSAEREQTVPLRHGPPSPPQTAWENTSS